MAAVLMPLDPLLVAAAIGLTVLVFARALLHKASDFETFRQQVEDYRLLPAALSGPVALLLGLAEAAVIAALLWPAARVAGGLGAMAVLLAYAGAMALNLARGRTTIDCGCGGPGQAISWTLVVRNLVLAAVAGLVLLPAATRPLGVLDMIALPVMVLTTWLVLVVIEQLARTFAHIRALRENGFD
ncbi:MauE/DoxX family redox-associated membrane protein [Prosthecodimorpha staleyi]|uniref:Methylamine utilization protein MauE n=1 Tax=Prosthecodimorpha staleyi TaxID=2840188 RepID=A0A947D2W9_9HYPH|nr:MauE/DoxX family redox-associated membrane protein [Prosthecodimorpha staleyi]MBT9289314.1 hypothetical protein [Prosthecodimorpha staleyi]